MYYIFWWILVQSGPKHRH